ncbi:MAG TPA: hypothetical protein VHY30_04765 [Verrucomicrobiae bacterium]|jgi:hypothetical protein|nr:hypothetical protein [Verrucomicrobiae bacterium]
MSYLTLEVEIDHGKVAAKDVSQLPEKGRGLLTVLETEKPAPQRKQIEALEELQKRLNLDDKKIAEWMETVRDARR